MLINPFENDIVSEPRKVQKSVSGLNEKILKNLLLRFQEIAKPCLPRKEKLAHVQFIVSPEPGFGKSHLIGRLFQELNQKATLVYLRPFEDPSRCWKSILLKMVQELNFPEKIHENFSHENPTQLEAFAHGILTYMLAKAVQNGAVKSKNKQATANFLLNSTLTDFRQDEKKFKWVQNNYKALVNYCGQQLHYNGIYLSASPLSWIGVLFTCAYRPFEFELKDTCLDWLKGSSIDPDEAKKIGIKLGDIGTPDMSSEGINSICKQRILDFCQLAGFFRPFVFCFDQTDDYGKDIMRSKALGSVIQILRDDCCNQMTIITANQHIWSQSIAPWFQDAQKDRLSPPLELEGLDHNQALELIKLRLEGAEQIGNDDDQWLNDLFPENHIKKDVMGIRAFLKRCNTRWKVVNGETSDQPYSIDHYYSKNMEAVKTQTKRLSFDPDTLRWLIHEVAKNFILVEKYTNHKYFSLIWQSDDFKYFFGFEDGSHWRVWDAVVRRAKMEYLANQNSKFIFFRTPEQPPIPGKKWKIAHKINNAQKKYLSLICLEKNQLIQLYAAYDLYIDAGEGNIPFKRPDVIKFLEQELKPFWDQLLKSVPDKEVTQDLVKKIREIVYAEKFISIDDLIKTVQTSKEQVYKAGEYIPEIKLHIHPNMSVFQWQSNK